MTPGRERDNEIPADFEEIEGIEQDENVKDLSDFYEMRVCEAPGCENFLPLDAPGSYVMIYGQRCLVCPSCVRRYE